MKIRWDYIVIALGFALVLILGTSCSCNWHLKKAIAKCGQIQNDTLIIHDTIRFDAVRKDTVFTSGIGDTVFINKDRLKIKYVRLPGDSVFISGKCDSVFVNRFIKVPYQKTVINQEFNKWQLLWLIPILLLIALFIRVLRA